MPVKKAVRETGGFFFENNISIIEYQIFSIMDGKKVL